MFSSLKVNILNLGQFHFSFFPTLIALCAIVILLRLGFWQIERSDVKQLRLEQIKQRASSKPYRVSEILMMTKEAADYPIELSGTLDLEHVFLWDNRVYSGQVGYEVLVPVFTSQGNVIVNFGWVKAGKTRNELPHIILPSDALMLQGVVWQPSTNAFIKETAQADGQWPKVIQEPNIDVIRQLLQKPLLPFGVSMTLPYDVQFKINYKAIVMSPEKHLAYAVQWFGLAIVCASVFLFASRKGKDNE